MRAVEPSRKMLAKAATVDLTPRGSAATKSPAPAPVTGAADDAPRQAALPGFDRI